jgi:hypothetical protein
MRTRAQSSRSGGDAAKMLDLVEEPLDQIAFLVDVFVARQGSRSGGDRWDYGRCPSFCNARAKTIGVEALVGQQMIEGQAGDQVRGSSWQIALVILASPPSLNRRAVSEGVET